jgi:hypothetical protein
MFYAAFAGVPEWAPPGENHILYSDAVLKDVVYAGKQVQYTSTQVPGTEYLRLAFRPSSITLNGAKLTLHPDLSSEGYTERELGQGDFALNVKRVRPGRIIIQ